MIIVEEYPGGAMLDQFVEIVERKGTGHPDTICDRIAEAISVSLCQIYLKEFGTILHHNIDKILLVAGEAEIEFGRGKLLKPMELIIGDRASDHHNGRTIPIADIVRTTACDWFRRNLRQVNPDLHLLCRSKLTGGSSALTDIFARGESTLAANDTSAVVGYWPLSATELTVLQLEKFLNGEEFKKRFPDSGEDVKIMGVRTGRQLELTVAMPLISTSISSESLYFRRKNEMREEMLQFASSLTDFDRVDVHFNTLDVIGRGVGGVYMSLLGTSADSADSGQVGRGNRVNGVIPLKRPAGSEAAAGKNPVSHIGKIYNLLAQELAREIQERVDAIKEVYVWLQNRIGEPINKPGMVNIQIVMEPGCAAEDVDDRVKTILRERLDGLGDFCLQLAHGDFPVC